MLRELLGTKAAPCARLGYTAVLPRALVRGRAAILRALLGATSAPRARLGRGLPRWALLGSRAAPCALLETRAGLPRARLGRRAAKLLAARTEGGAAGAVLRRRAAMRVALLG